MPQITIYNSATLPGGLSVSPEASFVAYGKVNSGLVLHLDSQNANSYPGTGQDWYDLSGYANHAVFSGTVTVVSGGIAFNGSSVFAKIADATSLRISQPTVIISCTRAAGTPLARGAYGAFWNYGITGLTTSSFKARNNNTDIISPTFEARDGVNVYCAVYNGTGCEFYRNDQYSGINSGSYSPSAGAGFTWIGAAENTSHVISEYYSGRIYTIKVYNRKLSAAEVMINYQQMRVLIGI